MNSCDMLNRTVSLLFPTRHLIRWLFSFTEFAERDFVECGHGSTTPVSLRTAPQGRRGRRPHYQRPTRCLDRGRTPRQGYRVLAQGFLRRYHSGLATLRPYFTWKVNSQYVNYDISLYSIYSKIYKLYKEL